MLLKLQDSFPFLRKGLPEKDLYGSSVYMTLHKDFVRWALNDKGARKFIRSLKNTTCSEEVMFATLIMNSPYKNTVVKKPTRFIDWNRENLILLDSDFDRIINSNCFFCRKVSSNESGNLARNLERRIRQDF